MTAFLALLFMCLAAAPQAHAAEPAPSGAGENLSVLLLGPKKFSLDERMQKRIEEAGFTVCVRELNEPLSDEQLEQFHLVVLPAFRGLQTPHFVPRGELLTYLDSQANLDRLRAYVKAGGGLMVHPKMDGGGQEVAEGVNALIQPWGARILAAGVRDEEHTGVDGAYAWTTQIEPSPVSEGVERLWYPINMLRWDDAYATVPLVLEDDRWQVVARGMPSSTAAKGIQYTQWLPLEDSEAPVIAAVAPAGKGRVAVLGVTAYFTLLHGYDTPSRGWIGESNTGPVDGIFLEKGHDDQASDGWPLIINTMRWLGEAGRSAGLGGYDPATFDKQHPPARATLPAWLTWTPPASAADDADQAADAADADDTEDADDADRSAESSQFVKVLLGARSRLSSGDSTVGELAEAARQAGYGVLIMTELFESLTQEEWDALLEACDEHSDEQLVVMPGLDIADPYGNRFLLFGQRDYPAAFMLDESGRALARTQYLSLGFGTHFTAIHRPSTTPLPHELYKFFAGIVAYTYEADQLADNGLLAYQWQVDNHSNPIPLVAREVNSADQLTQAAGSGRQMFVHTPAPHAAAWYLRAGMAHFWETPSLVLISEGPRVTTLSPGHAIIESDAPIERVDLISSGAPIRTWRPGTSRAELEWHLPDSHLRWCYLHIRDANGKTAITPAMRFGPTTRYTWRCSDRQNFFGFTMNYTGTRLPGLDIQLPRFGTDEGNGFWPHQRGQRLGENMAPLLSFPYASPAVYITDAAIDQRYFHANWEDVAYDGKPSHGTARSRVYAADVRYYDFRQGGPHVKRDELMTLMDVEIRLRTPTPAEGDVFPVFTRVGNTPTYGWESGDGDVVEEKLTSGFVDLPAGAYVGNLLVLSEGLRVTSDGRVGWAVPQGMTGRLPRGHTWQATCVRLPEDQVPSMRRWMGVSGEAPFSLNLEQGSQQQLAYTAQLEARDGGVMGNISPAPDMPYDLPLAITGLNANWDTGVWREGEGLQRFGVFEQTGWARLDVTRPGRFYAGHLIEAEHHNLHLTVLGWDDDSIRLSVHNPTRQAIQTTLRTPAQISDHYRLSDVAVEVPAGSSRVLSYPQDSAE